MKTFVVIVLLLGTVAFACSAKEKAQLTDWHSYFTKYKANGTLVIKDERADKNAFMVFNHGRAKQQYAPASTYNIPHTLFALNEGLAKDEFQLFRWDGINHEFPAHNMDQNLRSAMRNSATWVYEDFAAELGEKKAIEYLKKINYGNTIRTSDGNYWNDGKLTISAYGQIEFLKKLHNNQLPFTKEHQLLVKDLILLEAGKGWILRAKPGWQDRLGWWVGWVEWPTGPVYFALNINTPNRMADLYKREAIVRDILASIDALPAKK